MIIENKAEPRIESEDACGVCDLISCRSPDSDCGGHTQKEWDKWLYWPHDKMELCRYCHIPVIKTLKHNFSCGCGPSFMALGGGAAEAERRYELSVLGRMATDHHTLIQAVQRGMSNDVSTILQLLFENKGELETLAVALDKALVEKKYG